MKFFWNLLSKTTGKNSKYTPVSVIKDQLNEKRELPLGVAAFHEWSDRIISGACIPGATPESIKFALADQLMHLGPTVDFETDLYFIKCLRKFAINQVADAMRKDIRDRAKERLANEDKAKLQVVNNQPGEVTPLPQKGATDGKEVLSNN